MWPTVVALALGQGARPDPPVPPLCPEPSPPPGHIPPGHAAAAVDLDERLPPLTMAFLDGSAG
jgi:hypothetical protein